MAQRIELRQAMGQQMLLSPRMLQSIELLALPALELGTFLREAAEQNEALVVEEPALALPLERVRGRARADATVRHDEWLQNQPDRRVDTLAQLEAELALLGLDARVEAWSRWLLAQLDERGFLPWSDDELLARAARDGLDGGSSELLAARAALARLEPRGLGAHDAIEALLSQLDPCDPDFGPLQRILREFVGELARNHLPAVARELAIDMQRLRELLARLAQLEPAPGASLRDDPAPTVHPDVIVERTDHGTFEVRLEGSASPSLSLDARVTRLAADPAQPRDVQRYLRGKLESARWLVEAMELRGATLLAIARAIFARQREFLEHGPGHLVPFTMTALAEEIGLHVSTVSRTVAHKHAQTPHGIVALRELFPQAAAGGEGVRDDVREAVRALFATENPARPFSDDEVVAQLARSGHALARRTVAKYRAELGIASSYLRRRH
ncbi:MAG: RNA polymerase factor sigma-54 [Planctomycetes bacterium]|nr:RNA polymerase factor sigma-54 [Planctomycetota bacterium]